MPLRRGNGKWHWRFQIDGMIYRGATGLADTERNRTPASRIEHEARQKVLAGQAESLKLKSIPFNEAADQFLEWAEGEHRAHPQTARRLAVSFASCREFFGERPVRSVTAGTVEDYKNWRRRVHRVRDVTVRHDLHALSKFFRYAVKHLWARFNPVRDVSIPSDADAVREHILRQAEEFAYFEAARSYPNLHDLGRVMIRQGMRPSEVMSMKQSDVNLEVGSILIPHGKSRAARRTVYMSPDGEINSLLARRLDGGQWVFPGNKPGKHMTKLNNSHNKVLASTGLRFVLYDQRHTFATRMAQRGMDLATLAAILGHSNFRVVQRYIHISHSHRREAMHQYAAEDRWASVETSEVNRWQQ